MALLEADRAPLAGRYCLSRILSRGREGMLYLATTPGDPRDWVVKEVPEGLARNAERLAELRFQRLAPIREHLVARGHRYLVHEYIEGVPVAALARLGRSPLTREEVLEEALRLVEDLARMERAGVRPSARVLDPEHVLLDGGRHLRPVNPLPGPGTEEARGPALCGQVGELVSRLLPELPSDLAWFVSCCQGFQGLEQVERTLRELHGPDPEAPPAPGAPRRMGWLLLLALPLLLFLFLPGGPQPLPARVAVVSYADRVEVRDADSLALVSSRRGPPMGGLVALGPQRVAGALPSGLAVFAPGSEPTPCGPGPVAELACEPGGSWLASTAPSQGLVALQRVEPLLGPKPRARPALFSALGPGVRVAVGRPGSGEPPPLFVSEPARRTVTRYGVDPAALVAEVVLPDAGALALSPGGTSLDVALPALREVRRLDAATLRPRGPSVRLAGRPEFLVSLPEAVVALEDSGGITFLDPQTLQPLGVLHLGSRPRATSGALWVATERDLVALDPAKPRLCARVPLVSPPTGLAVLAVNPVVGALPGGTGPEREARGPKGGGAP